MLHKKSHAKAGSERDERPQQNPDKQTEPQSRKNQGLEKNSPRCVALTQSNYMPCWCIKALDIADIL